MHEIRFDDQGEAVSIGEVDVTAYEFGYRDTVLLQNELYKRVKDNYHYVMMIADIFEHVREEGWTGIGVITNADGSLFQAGVTTDDYGDYTVGSDHMCEVAQLASNGQAIEAALKEADLRAQAAEGGKFRERWFEGSQSVYLYDLGSEEIQKTVLSLESAMADYPFLDEETESELMDDMWLSVFALAVPSLHDSIDAEEFEGEFRGELDTVCPECGWNKEVEEYLEESDDYEECEDCGDWFDVSAPGTEKHPDPLCPTCGEEYRIRRDDAEEQCVSVFGFNPTNGDRLVIRWTDGYYYEWFANRREWVKRTRMRDTYVINE